MGFDEWLTALQAMWCLGVFPKLIVDYNGLEDYKWQVYHHDDEDRAVPSMRRAMTTEETFALFEAAARQVEYAAKLEAVGIMEMPHDLFAAWQKARNP